jgi:D-alanyl-D-alanine-carboxypeptidase/D-alanyl-D-alanine-endopeptidase
MAGLPAWAPTPVTGDPQAATAARWRWLAAQRSLPTTGRAASYSNIGYDILGDCLAAAAAQPYVDALGGFTGPLNLNQTTLVSADYARHLARGQGGFDQRAIGASGGLFSSASDMAGWLRHQLSGTPAVRASQQILVRTRDLTSLERLSNAGEPSGIGLGWLELPAQSGRPRLLQKTGGYSGFMSYAAIAPNRRVGAFVSVPSTSVDTVRTLATRTNNLLSAL